MLVINKKVIVLSFFILIFSLFYSNKLLVNDSFLQKIKSYFVKKESVRKKMKDLSEKEQRNQEKLVLLLIAVLGMTKTVDDLNYHYKRLNEESGNTLTEEMYQAFQNAYRTKLKELKEQKKGLFQF